MAWVATAVAVGGTLLGASEARKAQSQASDANAKALASQEKATDDQLNFNKQVYADGAADRKFASDNARQMSTWQGEDRAKYNGLQDEQIARGRTFQAAEDGILRDALKYNTEDQREKLAGKARADVQQGFASSESQQNRGMARMGVKPNSGRALALSNGNMIAKAGMLASAATDARDKAQIKGQAMKMDAVALGKGMIGNQATQAGLGLNSGNSSVQNGLVPLSVSAAANGTMSNAFGNAATGYSNLGNNQARSFYNAADYGAGVGSSIGNMFGGFSKNTALMNGIGGLFGGGGGGGGWSPSMNSDATNSAMAASLNGIGYGG